MLKVRTQSEWAARAAKVLPAAGFGNFDPSIFIREGKGSRVWDEDGNEYIDYLIGSGPMLLGHGHPELARVIADQASKLLHTGNLVQITWQEKLAERLFTHVHAVDDFAFQQRHFRFQHFDFAALSHQFHAHIAGAIHSHGFFAGVEVAAVHVRDVGA